MSFISTYNTRQHWPLLILGLLVISAISAPTWVLDSSTNVNSQSSDRVLKKGPFSQEILVTDALNKGKTTKKVTFILGTDILGRDILSRLAYGLRISLFIGFWSVVVSVVVGSFIGLTSGYFGGWLDQFMMLIINSLWSIPTILLVFALVLAIGRGMTNIVLAIGLTMWVDIARLIRGQTLQLRQKEFVIAGKSLGFSDLRIIMKHILPNIVEPLMVLATVNFATAILVEAGISYLGLGIQPPAPSLGQILAENYSYVLGGHYAKSIIPAFIIFIVVLCLNLSGTILRDYFDIKNEKTTA